jgi:putative transposase
MNPVQHQNYTSLTDVIAPNRKRVHRVHRVMRAHGLLLARRSGRPDERRHDGRIAVVRSNLRRCSDAFEVGCDDGGEVRVAFALECRDREALGVVATAEGITRTSKTS